jgi:uncharacterized alpha-E superfamily protein
MLSKVAERVYWTARYLERIESTARMISIYDKALFDLPRSVKISWYNLITINKMEDAFSERYSIRDERNVVKFLLGDESNYSSIVSSLAAIRENIRTTRDVVLEETWEMTNELNLFVQDNLQQGINRSKRHEFLDAVIKGCQQILGLLYGNLPHDEAWLFLRLGRNIERADMTTRNLDAGMAATLELETDEGSVYAKQIIWGNVLRSLNAELPYRRTMTGSVHGQEVLKYLIEDPALPRAIDHCFVALADTAKRLPRSEELVTNLTKAHDKLYSSVDYDTLNEAIREYLNDLQITIANFHQQISETWFPKLD